MFMIYDFCSHPTHLQSGLTHPQAYYIIVVNDEDGEIAHPMLTQTYKTIFGKNPEMRGPLGPFQDKAQVASYAQSLARNLGIEKIVLHSAADWNRLLERVRDYAGLEEILVQGEVLEGVAQGQRVGLFKRFFKDS